MATTGCLLQSLLQNLVAKNRLEQCVDHLSDQPHFRHILQCGHTDDDAMLRSRNNRLVRRSHLVYVHDECREQAVDTALIVSNVQAGVTHRW